jgi:hypothetical protein
MSSSFRTLLVQLWYCECEVFSEYLYRSRVVVTIMKITIDFFMFLIVVVIPSSNVVKAVKAQKVRHDNDV